MTVWKMPGRVVARSFGEEHVAQLGDGRVGEHPLDVVLGAGDGGGEQSGADADDRHHPLGGRAEVQVSARCGPPGRRRRSPWWRRGSAPTPVWGPPWHRGATCTAGIWADLPTAPRNSISDRPVAKPAGQGLRAPEESGASTRREVERVEVPEDQEQGDHEPEVADPVGDEGLLGRHRRAVPLEPETDQPVRAEAHAFPAEEGEEDSCPPGPARSWRTGTGSYRKRTGRSCCRPSCSRSSTA